MVEMLKIKRVYDPPSKEDGTRILVDRIWPRGVSKEKASIDVWLKNIAPSTELRKWFGHEPEKWEAFREDYWEELRKNPAAVNELKQYMQTGPVTLVSGARDEEHNNAVAIKMYLE